MVYRKLVLEQVNRITDARDNPKSQYDYQASIDTLAMILPSKLGEKAEDYRKKHDLDPYRVDPDKKYDAYLRFIMDMLFDIGIIIPTV